MRAGGNPAPLRTIRAELALIGKNGGGAKATGAAPTLLSLPSRERVGVRVHIGALRSPVTLTLSPSGPQWGRGKSGETRFRFLPIKASSLLEKEPLLSRGPSALHWRFRFERRLRRRNLVLGGGLGGGRRGPLRRANPGSARRGLPAARR